MRRRNRHSNRFRFRWPLYFVALVIGMAAFTGFADRGLNDRQAATQNEAAQEKKTGMQSPVAVRATAARTPGRGPRADERLRDRLAGLAPKGVYALVDTAENRLWLKKGDRILYEARVSTGSRTTLIDPVNTGRRWTFETPRGVFAIQSKLKSPVWVKPDWAFVEEGKALPAALNDRMEAGVLGDYALGFGEGYFIHGTLYTRLLGQNVTHGCIRMADRDLEFVFKNLPVGAPLFIY